MYNFRQYSNSLNIKRRILCNQLNPKLQKSLDNINNLVFMLIYSILFCIEYSCSLSQSKFCIRNHIVNISHWNLKSNRLCKNNMVAILANYLFEDTLCKSQKCYMYNHIYISNNLLY